MAVEKCVRCGRETPYDESTPVESRRYFIEGSGQLCLECWQKVFGDDIMQKPKDKDESECGHRSRR